VAHATSESAARTHRVGDHVSKLFKAQPSIAVLVRFHDRLVHDFLELGILRESDRQSFFLSLNVGRAGKLNAL